MSKQKNTGTQNSSGVDLKDKEDHKVEKPKKFKVVFYNDDYTPMDWVVILLISEFNLSFDAASNVMMTVHEKGRGIAGVYSKEIASTKSRKCNKLSRDKGYPLHTEIEPE